MSESLPLLVETADRLFADLSASRDLPFAAAWATLVEAGFPTLLAPEDQGGFGGDWQDAFAVIRLVGFHALATPLADAVVAGRAAALAGLDPAEGRASLAERVSGDWSGDRFSGVLGGVAFGRDAAFVIAATPRGLIRLRVSDAASVDERTNPAGEPRHALRFQAVAADVGAPVDVFALGALARTAQIAGAMDAALGLSVGHANERVQFGKPISKFQAVQQSLAILAEEAAAANCAGQTAARSAEAGEAGFEIAAAKLRAGIAAQTGVAVAHQIHGAIGFTRDHVLHRFTGRLIAWRSEFGNGRVWAAKLAAHIAQAGPEGFWPMITARADAAMEGQS